MTSESRKTGGRKLGLLGRQPGSVTGKDFQPESKDRCLNDQEIEAKFNSISLSLRTEAFTLQHRLEHQRRQRDLCEANMKKEIEQLVALLKVVQQEMARLLASHYNSDGTAGSQLLHENLSRALKQVDVVSSSARRVSSSAETLGAVEHEWRLSSSVDLLIEYVDNVKRKWEKEHRELHETKRILQESGLNLEECFAALNPAQDSIPPAGFNSRRRASVPAAPPSRKISLLASPLKLAFRSSAVTVDERDEESKVPSAVQPTASDVPGASEVVRGARETASDGVAGVEQQLASSQKDKGAYSRKRRISKYKNSSRSLKQGSPSSSSSSQLSSVSRFYAYLVWNNNSIWQRCVDLVCKQTNALRQQKWRTSRRNGKVEAGNVLRWVRYTFAGLCLLAAAISLVITFVPADSFL